MFEHYRVSRNIASGNEEEYRALRKLAEKHNAVSIEDEIDLDCYDHPVGEYGKYYLQFGFPDLISRDLFVMEARKVLTKK